MRETVGSRIEVAGRGARRLPGVIEEVLEGADRERYFRVRRDDGKAVFYFPRLGHDDRLRARRR